MAVRAVNNIAPIKTPAGCRGWRAALPPMDAVATINETLATIDTSAEGRSRRQ
jgi:hypothetical protein